MSWYRVLLNGAGISVLVEGGSGAPCIGFYVNRSVRASSPEEAVAKVKARIAALWETGQYRRINSGPLPVLNAEEVEEIGFLDAWRMRKEGHVFYSQEE